MQQPSPQALVVPFECEVQYDGDEIARHDAHEQAAPPRAQPQRQERENRVVHQLQRVRKLGVEGNRAGNGRREGNALPLAHRQREVEPEREQAHVDLVVGGAGQV